MSETIIQASDPLMENLMVRQIVTQLRALDSYGTYDTWEDYRVLDPIVLTKERRREIPVVGDPDEVTISRLKAYYNAVAAGIEREVELMAVPLINLTHEGFGKALITVGRLVVINKTLRDVHRFGFDSLEALVKDLEKNIGSAVEIVTKYREVAEL
ncbi:NifX-associated nitrogen fixation protein [Aurantivibrio plasticivorans]